MVIPEGVMDDFINFRPEEAASQAFLKKYNLQKNYIFYPAQHWQHKNHLTLVKAVAYANKKYNLCLKLVLTGEKRPSANELYDYIDKNGCAGFIRFIGNISFDELFYGYYNALVMAMPSLYESSSLPVKEAMGIGTPIIASANGSNEEINLDHNIILHQPENHIDLGEKIFLVYQNKELRKRMSEKSKAIIKNYLWDKVAEKYVSAFQKIYDQKN